MSKPNFEQDLLKISKTTGIDIETLKMMNGSETLQVIMAYNSGDLSDVYSIAQEKIYLNMLKEISEFLQKPYEDLINLPHEKIESLVGQYTMEIGITDDEKLRNNLIKLIDN